MDLRFPIMLLCWSVVYFGIWIFVYFTDKGIAKLKSTQAQSKDSSNDDHNTSENEDDDLNNNKAVEMTVPHINHPKGNGNVSLSIDGSNTNITKDNKQQDKTNTTQNETDLKKRILTSIYLILLIVVVILDRIFCGLFGDSSDYQIKVTIYFAIWISFNLFLEFLLHTLFKIPPPIRAMILDIVNNVGLIVSFVIYARDLNNVYMIEWFYELWLPIIWGHYCTDLIMIMVFWNRFTNSWKSFVFIHHGASGMFIIIINHRWDNMFIDGDFFNHSLNEIDQAEWNAYYFYLGVLFFFESNSFGCAPEIIKYFKLFENHTGIVIPILYFCQRMFRLSSYLLKLELPFSYHIWSPVNYGLIFIAAISLDIFDHFFQATSMIKYYLLTRNLKRKGIKQHVRFGL